MRTLRHAAEPYPVVPDVSRDAPRGRDAAAAAARQARLTIKTCTPLPHPGGGNTWGRWSALARVARADLSVARLVEGHVDARAILVELGRRGPPGLMGVWAARPERLRAVPTPDGWRLDGDKPFCSGSILLDHALVAATTPDGPGLFLVSADLVRPVAGTWEPLGMYATRSETLLFEQIPLGASMRIGGTGAYVERPGFGHGGCGVAACWWGGTLGVLDDLETHAPQRSNRSSEAIAVRQLVSQVEAELRRAAALIDHDPTNEPQASELAARVRASAASAGREALAVAGRHLGTAALAQRPVSQRLADLTMYLSQHRAPVETHAAGEVRVHPC